MTTTSTPAWAHPDPAKKLFGFHALFADGTDSWGLIVATDKETARLHVENDTLACYAVELIVEDQPAFVDAILTRYDGLAYLCTEPRCN